MGLSANLSKLFPYLQLELDRADIKVEVKRYLAMCVTATTFLFLFLTTALTLLLSKIGKNFLGLFIAFIFSLIIFSMQVNYPKVLVLRRIRKLEADLLASLRAIMIQLNSVI